MYIDEEFKKFIYDNCEFIFNLRNIDSNEIQNMNIELNKVIKYNKYFLYKENNSSDVLQLQSMDMQVNTSDDFHPEKCRTLIRGSF
jgi:hypothetical protein